MKKLLKSSFLFIKYAIITIFVFFVFVNLILGSETLKKMMLRLFILSVIFLPLALILSFKEKLVMKFPRFNKVWVFIKIVYFIGMVLFIIVCVFGFYLFLEKDKTDDAIGRINSRRITMEDVMGKNLPPKPDQALNDSTIAGIDANRNTIRDDVELAIFERYSDSAKIRAAMLQYAQALQLELTEVFNSETLVKTIQKEGLAYRCLSFIDNKNLDIYEKEIEDIILNTEIRTKRIDDIYKHMTTYSLLNDEPCDISPSLLSN